VEITMLMKPLPQRLNLSVLPLEAHALRCGLALSLSAASRALQGWAERLATLPARPVPPMPTTVLEFHAEAGAPEGALYVDGVLVGYLAGVHRL
jgi:hypothetical protein